MTSTRAILVSEEQRNAIFLGSNDECDDAALDLAKAFDNAGDQPRIRWCVEHGSEVWGRSDICLALDCMPDEYVGPCRVVTAIIVPVEEDA